MVWVQLGCQGLANIKIHAFSLRFTQTYSDFLRFVLSHVQSHQIQISADPLRFTTPSHSDLLRLTQIYPDWFNVILISLDLHSLAQFQINSDTFRSTHSRSDSLRLTQIFSDCFNVIEISFDYFELRQIH